ncbi:MAG TPA: UvrD-helicase domain-containing protein [Candidatus Binatia bacterium]|jgi:ATP-dependent exoDNAse (exonuclease V) beta subunit
MTATDERALTDEQRAAVACSGSVLVRAGAGSGKTVVLVERYVQALCGERGTEPLEIEQIIAVTFTEKAAAEMRDRIRARLGARGARADGDERRRLLRIQRALQSACIGTIHALAAALLRAAPVEAGIDPAARVLDEIEGPAYVEREVRRALLARLRAGDEDVRRCAEAWGFGGAGGDLVASVTDTLASLARRGVPVAALGDALARQAEATRATLGAAGVRGRAMVASIDGWVAGAGRALPEGFCARWPAWRAALCALDEAGAEGLVPLRAFPSEAGRALRKRPGWSEHAELLAFAWQDGTPRFRGVLAAAFGARHGLTLAEGLGRVIAAVDAQLAAAKRRDGVLTFDDLIVGANAMLAAHPATAARLLGEVRAVLVDEFQDTDPIQIALVRRLASGGGELFAVGDEKQSIYRFRGADVEVFADMRRTIGVELPLADNFRSRPALLAFVNGLAARLFAAPAEAPPWRVRWSAEQRLRARREPHEEAPRPAIRLVSLASQIEEHRPPLAAAPARALEARVVAATISELLGEGWRARDVAVLLPALTQVKAYEFALRRCAIPYEIVRGRGFYQCQEIRDLVHLLAAVVDPEDELALATALRSPLFGLSDTALERLTVASGRLGTALAAADVALDADDAAGLAEARRVLCALRKARDRVTVAELLTQAIDATGIEQVLTAQFHGAQKVANVRKLVARARALGRRGFLDAATFVARARELLDEVAREPEAARLATDVDAVQVMTVHQAKGLEFPVVILPDLAREAPRDYRSPVVVDPRYGLLASATFGAGRHRLPHALIEEWRQDDRERGEAERARLLYVACTRARELLVLCEGKGRVAALREQDGTPARSACEHLWAFLGRERVAAFLAGSDVRVVLDATGEDAAGAPVLVPVELEKSAALLARVRPPEADAGETSLARVADAVPTGDEVAAVASVLDRPEARAAPLVVSPTALADYARCPRQFWHRHVRGVPEGGAAGAGATDGSVGADERGAQRRDQVVAGPDDAAEPRGDARLGIAAHAALEVLPLDLPEEARAAAVAAALAPVRDLIPAERAALARDLEAALARAAAEGDAFRLLGREMPFCVALDALPTLYVRGRIDVVGEREGGVVVRDYKYARASGDAEAYRVQLEAYALAVAVAEPGRSLTAEIEWLRAPGARVTLAIDLAAARARLRVTAGALASAMAARRAEAFPQAFDAPAPCRAIGCAFVTRCFPPRYRGFREQAPSGSMAP